MAFYLSLQYSAIQKTVLRHDRLWSIAGISQILSEINELTLPKIAEKNGGTVIVAGGGKFTASFEEDSKTEDSKADKARQEIIKLISTTLPMLEFQCSEVVKANNLQDAKALRKHAEYDPYPGLVDELNEKKRCFRGYGVTYNPHIRVCDECGEYPGVVEHPPSGQKEKEEKKDIFFCRTCDSAWKAKVKARNLPDELTTMQRIYKGFLESTSAFEAAEIPLNFDDLFEETEEKGKRRLAVWASDVNSMGDKVPVWIGTEKWLKKQGTEEKEMTVKDTFEEIKELNVKIIVEALKATFNDPEKLITKDKKRYMPFRLVVAGGDDLCIVMRDQFILDFTMELSKSFHEQIDQIEKDGTHPLSKNWLEEHAKPEEMKNDDGTPVKKEYKPHSFGGAFIVTSVHTPFKKIHHTLEELLKKAKEKSGRKDNCVNWRVLSLDTEEKGLAFEKPLYVDVDRKPPSPAEEKDIMDADKHLSFNVYCKKAKDCEKLSGSHRQQIASKMIEFKDENDYAEKLETWLKRLPAAREKDSAINELLLDSALREGEDPKGKLLPNRIATLLELMSIMR